MRPAGMSSDEDEDDDYFSMTIIPKRRDRDVTQPKLMEYLPPDHSDGLVNLLSNSSKSSLFHKAADEADFSRMEELLENGASVDHSKINEWTPLMKACSVGKYGVVQFLLHEGADPNLHKELFTPLMACCTQSYIPEADRLECVRLLIQFGVNVNAADKHKSTALMMAAGNGLNDIVSELLNVPNIDINVEDKEGWNALFHAAHNNNKAAAEKLINAGICTNTLNRHGEYGALQLAEMKNFKGIVEIIKMSQSEPVPDKTTTTPVPDVFDIIRYTFNDFRNQFPDEKGRGGFSRDVRDIFAGAGFGKLYEKLNINMGFPDFLAGTNLAEVGVKYEPVRQKLEREIHRYHLAPWARDSLYPIFSRKELNMDNYIEAISNIMKHLAIMYATLDYVRGKIKKWDGKTYAAFDRYVMDLLVESYVEIQKTKKLLENISVAAAKIKAAGEVEADYIGRKKEQHHGGERNWKIVLLKAGIASSVIYLCYKLRFS